MKASTLREWLESGKEVILVDVREPEEIRENPFFATPPKMYLNIPLMSLVTTPKEELAERIFGVLGCPASTLIVTLCRSGGRSARACEKLLQFGWKAENLDGGLLDWENI